MLEYSITVFKNPIMCILYSVYIEKRSIYSLYTFLTRYESMQMQSESLSFA